MMPSHGAIPPGGTLRLAVGESDGPRSQTWKIFTSKNWPDVYIGPRAARRSASATVDPVTGAPPDDSDTTVDNRTVVAWWSQTAPDRAGQETTPPGHPP